MSSLSGVHSDVSAPEKKWDLHTEQKSEMQTGFSEIETKLGLFKSIWIEYFAAPTNKWLKTCKWTVILKIQH